MTHTIRNHRSDTGAIVPAVAALSVAIMLLVGAIFDGGNYIRAQADTFGIAAAAARAGAAQIDQTAILRGEFLIDPTAAEQAAQNYLEARDLTGTVTIDGLTVTVTAQRTVEFTVIPGSGSVNETATARATQERAAP